LVELEATQPLVLGFLLEVEALEALAQRLVAQVAALVQKVYLLEALVPLAQQHQQQALVAHHKLEVLAAVAAEVLVPLRPLLMEDLAATVLAHSSTHLTCLGGLLMVHLVAMVNLWTQITHREAMVAEAEQDQLTQPTAEETAETAETTVVVQVAVGLR
jgi:hypothetical protein